MLKDLDKPQPAGTGLVSEETDGRRRRSLDSRARIVAAMLDLVREGEVSPGAETVAARAEVGLRTVFRHFKDMDSLYGERSHAVEGELTSAASRPLLAGAADDRVLELVDRRSAAFERIAPFKRAADAHRHHSTFLVASQERLVSQSRDILQAVAPDRIAADPARLEAIDLLLSFEAWNRLRREQGLSAARTREVLALAVSRMLAE